MMKQQEELFMLLCHMPHETVMNVEVFKTTLSVLWQEKLEET
jgi:hypothetical protein